MNSLCARLPCQVVAQYKSYLANIATHMVSLEQQALQQAQQQEMVMSQNSIVGVMIELGSFCERVGMYCPVNLKRLFSHNLETLQQPDGELRSTSLCPCSTVMPVLAVRAVLLPLLGSWHHGLVCATHQVACSSVQLMAPWPCWCTSCPGNVLTHSFHLRLRCRGAHGPLAQRAGSAQPD